MTGSDLIAAWAMGGFAALALLLLAAMAVRDLIDARRRRRRHTSLED